MTESKNAVVDYVEQTQWAFGGTKLQQQVLLNIIRIYSNKSPVQFLYYIQTNHSFSPAKFNTYEGEYRRIEMARLSWLHLTTHE